ncbi:MAG: rhodanese-like domain-containing protein, partial [Gemmatimonadetes bacterium]|nr:rhodanese-like domain-containing protein [Gemmatimonadota bacterium]
VMGGFLQDRLDEVPWNGSGVAVVCGSGYRSTVAASVLERAGFRNVLNIAGGMTAWRRVGLPVAID